MVRMAVIRAVWSPLLLVVSAFTFVLTALTPSDAARTILGTNTAGIDCRRSANRIKVTLTADGVDLNKLITDMATKIFGAASFLTATDIRQLVTEIRLADLTSQSIQEHRPRHHQRVQQLCRRAGEPTKHDSSRPEQGSRRQSMVRTGGTVLSSSSRRALGTLGR